MSRLTNLQFAVACCVIAAACSKSQSATGGPDVAVVDGGSDAMQDQADAFDPTPGTLGQESAQQCGSCHVEHYRDWSGSMHAYATVDPVFTAMLHKGVAATEGKLDQFCIQCHAPVASKLGMTPVYEDDSGTFVVDFDDSNPLVRDGVVCVTCHSMSKAGATLNADFELSSETFFGPTGNAAANEAHPIVESSLLVSSTMCGTCHNVVNPKGALLENTFNEWYQSELNTGDVSTETTCQDCHMPQVEGEIVEGVRTTIHRHTFVGVDLALVDDFPQKEEQFRLVEELLRGVADMEIERTENQDGNVAFRVSVTNSRNGHALPSGSVADRQMWVHVVATDEQGNVLVESGMTDANGDLMDRVDGHSLDPDGDPDLLLWGALLFDEQDEHVNFPWEAARSQDFLLQPGQTGWREYEFPIAAAQGQRVTVSATLRYRTFPPFLLRQLEEEGFLKQVLSDKIPIVDMAEEELSFVVE